MRLRLAPVRRFVPMSNTDAKSGGPKLTVPRRTDRERALCAAVGDALLADLVTIVAEYSRGTTVRTVQTPN